MAVRLPAETTTLKAAMGADMATRRPPGTVSVAAQVEIHLLPLRQKFSWFLLVELRANIAGGGSTDQTPLLRDTMEMDFQEIILVAGHLLGQAARTLPTVLLVHRVLWLSWRNTNDLGKQRQQNIGC